MRKLQKTAVPAWLERNRDDKTREYLLALEANKLRPWSNPEIMTALREESNKKCIYCECMIDDGAYSTVDHIKPKKYFPELILDWANLGLACSRCNTNKKSYWTDEESQKLLNPFEDDIEEHILFSGPLTIAALSSSRAENTLRQLKFTEREDLFMSRVRRIEELNHRLRAWAKVPDGDLRELLAQDVEEAIDDSREFSSVLQAYARSLGFIASASNARS